MLSTVDEKLAFLSALLLASGAKSVAPSANPLDTVPKATASIIAPLSAAPSLNATLLLFVTDPPVTLSQAILLPNSVLHQRKYPFAGITSPSLNATIEVSADAEAVLFINL